MFREGWSQCKQEYTERHHNNGHIFVLVIFKKFCTEDSVPSKSQNSLNKCISSGNHMICSEKKNNQIYLTELLGSTFSTSGNKVNPYCRHK